jgi:hypothetical protein
MHRPIIALLAAMVLAAALPGCSNVRESLGIGGKKQGPDEFMVTSRRQPLALPPDYNLRPPEPGAPARQDELAADEAKRAVFGDAAAGAAVDRSQPGFDRLSEGETNLLEQAGALGVDPNIRYVVDRETVALVGSSTTLVDQILFWREPARPETLLDAGAEAERLRQNAEAGKPPTEGETPTIKRKKRGILDGLLN